MGNTDVQNTCIIEHAGSLKAILTGTWIGLQDASGLSPLQCGITFFHQEANSAYIECKFSMPSTFEINKLNWCIVLQLSIFQG
jgi:hypothetical protein